MNKNLLSTLVERKLVNTDTVVRAKIPTVGFHEGQYIAVKDVHWESTITADNIIDIEGMDPDRFAKSYNIKPDGSVKAYKKRGRKPKILA
jgi:hypothetical protein|tara:strand:- start:1694 stop:1963 length:270 start_codon:yes stop_codon:yes gene_type:complete